MGDDITIGVTEIVNNIEVTAQPNDQVIDINVTDNSDEVTLNVTPNVIEVNINKGSSYARWGSIFGNLTDQADLTNALFNKADLVDGKVPSYQLPSFVDDVIEVANYAALPTVGEIGKIYITLDNNKIYRWSGSIYIEIASNQAIWGAITGSLTNQTDLVNALNLKADKSTTLTINGTTFDLSANRNYTIPTHDAVTLGTANGLSLSGQVLSLGLSGASSNGALSSTDWNTFNNKLSSLSGAVLTTTDQTINGVKSFLNRVNIYTNNSVGLNVEGEGDSAIPVVFSRLNQSLITLQVFGSIQANKYIVRDGLSSQFLKADGSLDSNTYLTSLSGAVLTSTDQSVAGVKTFTNLAKFTNNTGSFAVEIDTTSSDALVVKNNGTTTLQISRSGEILGTKYRVSGGFASQFLKANGDLDSTAYTPASRTITINGVTQDLTANRSFTVATHDAVTIGTANGLSLSGQALSLALSSGSTTGALSAADWTTFNNKQNTITNPITGSGTINFLPKFTQSGSIGNSQIFDNGTFIGIGISTGLNRILQVVGSTPISHKQTNSPLEMIIGQFDDSGNAIINNTANAILGFSTNNQRAITILPNLNVGIGTTSPTAKLSVNGTLQITGSGAPSSGTGLELFYDGTGAGTLAFSRGVGYIPNYMDGSQLQFFTSSSERMRITSGGNVGIGTTSPSAKLTILGSNSIGSSIPTNWAAISSGRFGMVNGNNSFYFDLNPAPYAELSTYNYSSGATFPLVLQGNGGNVGIGTTSPSYQLQLSTDSAAKPTSALWTIASDERIKENINSYTKGLNELLKINPITYDYNGLGGFKKGKGGVGIIAQEIAEILPDSVSSIKGKLNETDEEEIDILNFNGHELTYILINAVKELKAEIELLKQK